jgi:MgtC family
MLPFGDALSHAAAAPALNGEGWRQAAELALALVLSALIGLEREIRQKSAGLRTHTLVGVGAALFMLISKYGFTDVLEPGRVVLDPSRVAAQIVTGVGFLGAGLIFVRRDAVRGLTTAAAIWVTAAIGSASGAGLPVLAVLATGAGDRSRVRHRRRVYRARRVSAGLQIWRGSQAAHGAGHAARPRQEFGQRSGRFTVRDRRRRRHSGQRCQRSRRVKGLLVDLAALCSLTTLWLRSGRPWLCARVRCPPLPAV